MSRQAAELWEESWLLDFLRTEKQADRETSIIPELIRGVRLHGILAEDKPVTRCTSNWPAFDLFLSAITGSSAGLTRMQPAASLFGAFGWIDQGSRSIASANPGR